MSDEKTARVPEIESAERVLLVGLGNPGRRYAGTRHNIGFLVIDELARRHGIELTATRWDGLFGEGRVGEKRVALLKPQTFMNLSGRSVAPACRYLSIERGALVVVHDDVDLDPGRIRLKWAGGNAGHNGLRSLDSTLGGNQYFRIRMGVGRPELGTVRDYVLGRFSSTETEHLPDILEGGAEAAERLLSSGLKRAQNDIHSRGFGSGGTSAESRNREASDRGAGG